jgi:proline dehydrogenase
MSATETAAPPESAAPAEPAPPALPAAEESLSARVGRSLNPVFRKGIRVATNNRVVAKAGERLTTNVALKLTHLGLDLGEELAYANVAELVQHAAARQNFIRIDMEESTRVEATLRIYRRLREAKGAYLEPPSVAYPKKADVDAAYLRLAERMLLECSFVGIATHDERLVEHVIAFAAKHGLGNDRYELQLLYGIRPQLQLDLVRRGHRVLIATPFGPDWYYYLMRRLAERPANVLFFAQNLVRR